MGAYYIVLQFNSTLPGHLPHKCCHTESFFLLNRGRSMKAERLPRQFRGGGSMEVSCGNRRRQPVSDVYIAGHGHHVQLLGHRCPAQLLRDGRSIA